MYTSLYTPIIVLAIMIVILITTLFFAWFFYNQARHKERMILIEKGENIDALFDKENMSYSFPWLKLGILITGLSFGFLGQSFLVHYHVTNNEPLYLFVLGFCGGVAMIIAHYVEKRQARK